ncbi:piggyBac transposable element-derived protein 4-like [Centruroides sculpturatus]|uniref:piggyBac transposable element-derived protein 4-like n=1 Tax=Centruroides sculpturatus TaxID=218467 RepID=UPI000C6DA919|nr:piggyBac transposable element-derived protein 4-like [Centruroides sculpturatus]
MASSSNAMKIFEEEKISTFLEQLSDVDIPLESSDSEEECDVPERSDVDALGGYSSDEEWEEDNEPSTNSTCSRSVTRTTSPSSFPFPRAIWPKNVPSSDSHPVQYFNLFFTMSILSLMVTETNRYAQQVINGMGGNVPEYLKKWKEVTIKEMKGFLAFLLNMGLNKKSSYAKYFSTSDSQYQPWFGKMFTLHRFSHLLRFFHLVDNTKLPGPGELGYDPSARYKLLEDHANKVFRHHYTPHKEICIDESMVGTKCHTGMRQYMKQKKHHQWGIKLWVMCDSTSHYCLGFFTYKGAKFQADVDKSIASKFGQPYTVVCRLMDMGDYYNKGHHLFVDNYFMSVPLIRHLHSQATYCTGTVRKNRKQLPLRFKENFKVGQISYFRSGPILACGFRDKKSQKQSKPVLLLSSHAQAREDQIVKRGQPILRPEIVSSYNKFMGGVDIHDSMLIAYLDERRSKKYWKKVAFNIIARMLLNAYILYKENCSGSQRKALSHVDFIVAVIERKPGGRMDGGAENFIS